MTDNQNLKNAIEAAERFLKACLSVEAEETRAQNDYEERLHEAGGQRFVCKYVSRVPHASAKRASMDLTRALAQLRKPGAF